ncbi:amidohydrolase family protein [Cucumibacter marinus]|uniref:amidohydrolase family protein n=1 Tax=Cucumibacter marinus TaxID=1121252 RepID=UPI00048D5546|nr:amidohydrolase family protein [Cucumibacter marinus]
MTKTPAEPSGWDIHTHLIPPALLKLADKGAFDMRRDPKKLHVCGHGVPIYPISDATRLIERIEADSLEGAVVSAPPPVFRPDLAEGNCLDYARALNDGLREACEGLDARLRPLAYLPAERPAIAAEIAAGLDEGWAGVVMGTDLGKHSYADKALDPLWQTLSDKALTLFIHPGSTPDRRLDPFYLGNLIGNPVETTIATAHLTFAGVTTRYPALNIVLAHGGGATAALSGRWQRGHDTDRPGIDTSGMPPREALRRFYVDSLVHDPGALELILATFGEDRVVLGSDWPFPMGAPSADHDIGRLPEDLRHKIRKTNAEAAFGARLRAPGR